MRTDIKRPLTPDLKLFHSVRFWIRSELCGRGPTRKNSEKSKPWKDQEYSYSWSLFENHELGFQIYHLIGLELQPITTCINLETIIRNVPSRKVRSVKCATGMIRFIIKEFKLILFILWKMKNMVGSEMIDNEQENVKELCNYIWYM